MDELTFRIKDVIDEDFANYKKPSMFIATSQCSFKCEKEDKCVKCQNSKIATQPSMIVSIKELVNRFINNTITEAVVIGGLEPFDQMSELMDFITYFRKYSDADIVIYTGYDEFEIESFKFNKISFIQQILKANLSNKNLKKNPNIIIKYGRFKIDKKRYDEILGITLASSNQYAKIY